MVPRPVRRHLRPLGLALASTLDASDTTVYVVAVVAAASFFASIVAHEFGHALAARREGIAVEGIDLFLFGGVMKMSRETDSPGAEFRVAVAGPLVTLLLMVARLGRRAAARRRDSFWDAARLSAAADASPVEVVVSLLVSMNLVLLCSTWCRRSRSTAAGSRAPRPGS